MTIESSKSLVLGGIKSGKSHYAETLANDFYNQDPENNKVYVIGTGEDIDDEMGNKINKHKLNRLPHFTTIDETLHLKKVIQEISSENSNKNIIIIECLTFWLNNVLYYVEEKDQKEHIEGFLNYLYNIDTNIIIVSNEMGMSLIPSSEVGRQFVSLIGRLHQDVAKIVDNVYFMYAGIPQKIK